MGGRKEFSQPRPHLAHLTLFPSEGALRLNDPTLGTGLRGTGTRRHLVSWLEALFLPGPAPAGSGCLLDANAS